MFLPPADATDGKFCGGFGGLECGKGKFCNLEGAACGAADDPQRLALVLQSADRLRIDTEAPAEAPGVQGPHDPEPLHDAIRARVDLVAAVSNVLLLAQASPDAAPEVPEPMNGVRALRRFVQAWMPGVPFRIIEGETFNPGHLSPQNLLTIYAPTAGGNVCAVAAANMPALCMLGGGAIQADPKDIRRAMPRFAPAAYAANLRLLDEFAGLARDAGCTPAQLAIAWLLHQAEHIVPIPGTTSASHLSEDLGASGLVLGADILARLDRLFRPGAIQGQRYNAATMAEVDTEEFAVAGA